MTPFCAVRTSIGSATASAASAAALSPDPIASSTLRSSLFIRVRRPLLISVRRAAFRAAFLAEVVFAMAVDPLRYEVDAIDGAGQAGSPGAAPVQAQMRMPPGTRDPERHSEWS